MKNVFAARVFIEIQLSQMCFEEFRFCAKLSFYKDTRTTFEIVHVVIFEIF